MKKKLTVTIDEDLLPRAKRYARSRGVSLSQLIEDSLRQLAPDEETTFADRWRGRFAARELGDERYERLAGKYL